MIISFSVIGAVVALLTQPLGEAAHERRRHTFVARDVLIGVWILRDRGLTRRVVAHLHRPDTGRVHPRDQRRPRWRAYRRRRECVGVADPLAGEPVTVWRRHGVVAVAPEPRAHVLRDQPDDIWLTAPLRQREAGDEEHDQQTTEHEHDCPQRLTCTAHDDDEARHNRDRSRPARGADPQPRPVRTSATQRARHYR